MYNDGKVHRAALVPYIITEDGDIRMMFMKPAADVAEWSGDCFQLAKGKIEKDETAEFAAIREAHEELGLFRGNVILTEEVGVFMGRTTVFVSKVKDQDMFGLPSDETSDTAWMTRDEFLDEGRDLHKPVVEACVRKICLVENMRDPPRGVPINEVFDHTPELVRYEKEGDTISGHYYVEGHPYVASIEYGNVVGINFGNVQFAAITDEGPDYNPQNWKTSPYKVLGGVLKIINKLMDDHPEVHMYIFGADNKHGDVKQRMKLYNFIARRYAKRMGLMKENIPTKNGMCTIVHTSDVTSDDWEDVIKFLKTTYSTK